MTNKDVLILFATKKPRLLLELLNDCYCIGFNDGANDNVDSQNIPTFDENWLNQKYDKNLFRESDIKSLFVE